MDAAADQQSEHGRRASYAEVLRHRNFALVFVGQTVSQAGNGAFQVALGWAVYSVTGSAADMGVVLAANAIPQVLLFLFGGVLGDRLSRRSVILAADAAAGLVTAALAVLAAGPGLNFGVLLVGAALLGMTSALYGPAYGAIVPDVLPGELVLRGNALLGASANLARVCGPALAGVLYALGGAWIVFGLDAASFLVSAACMVATAVPAARAVYKGTMRGDIREGLAYAGRQRWLQLVMAIGLVANVLCVAPLFVLLPAIVRHAHGGPGALGLVIAVQMAVATLSALLIPRFGRLGDSGVGLAVLAGALGLGVVVVGVGHSVAVLLLGMAVVGIGFGFNVVESTLLQLLVPRALLSRIYSLMLAASFALLPVGYAASGVLAQQVGLTAVMCFGGLALLIISLWASFSPSLRELSAVAESGGTKSTSTESTSTESAGTGSGAAEVGGTS
ncbi:MAG: MFS transporter [Jatrophihabitans sp.]